jgi:hypothetical protein
MVNCASFGSFKENMNHLIDEMLTALRPVLKSRTGAKKILERYWRNKIAIVWDGEDVHRAANERELALTEKEAREILAALYQSHNAQFGIKWEDIYDLIEEKCVGRKLTKPELKRFVERDIITVQK